MTPSLPISSSLSGFAFDGFGSEREWRGWCFGGEDVVLEDEEEDEASRSWRLMRGGEVLSLLLLVFELLVTRELEEERNETGIGAWLSRTKRRWRAVSWCEVEGESGDEDEEVEILLGFDFATS
jgi:hypothetical protein